MDGEARFPSAADTVTSSESATRILERPLRILYHHRTRSRDGQAVHIEELIRALRHHGCEVKVVEPGGVSDANLGTESRGLSVLRRWMPKVFYELLELAYSIIAFRRLRAAYLEFRPDALYERHNLFFLAGVWLKRLYGVRYLLEVNAPLYAERIAHGGLALPRLARWTERLAWRSADFVLPVTSVLAGIVETEGVDRSRLVVIPNGIDNEAFSRAPDTHSAKERFGLIGWTVLGFTGFLRAWHRLDRAIEFLSMPEGRNCLLFVVGDGPAREDLEALATARGVRDRVRFTGVVERDRVADHIMAFDIALQPAATAYASPLKLFEYMALSRAIVAPAQPNVMEILEDQVSAVLFDPANPTGLIKALGALVSNDSLRVRIARGARDTIDSRGLTWSRNAQRVMALIQSRNRDAAGRFLPNAPRSPVT